jgi:hypothetical protein
MPFHSAVDPGRAGRPLPQLSPGEVRHALHLTVDDDGGKPAVLAALALQDAAGMLARAAGYDVHGVGRLTTTPGRGGIATASGGFGEHYPGMVWMARSMATIVEDGIERLATTPFASWRRDQRERFTEHVGTLVHEASHTIDGLNLRGGQRSVGPVAAEFARENGFWRDVPQFEEQLTELVMYATTPEFMATSLGIPQLDAQRAVDELRAARTSSHQLPRQYSSGVLALDAVLARVEPDSKARGELARMLAERVPATWRIDDLTKRVLRAGGVRSASHDTQLSVARAITDIVQTSDGSDQRELDRAIDVALRKQAAG